MAARERGKTGRRGKPAGKKAAARRGKIDSVDIARLVGVARSTVSKVLNGYPHVAARTRESAGHFSEEALADFLISSIIENAAAVGCHALACLIRPADEATRGSLKEAFSQRRIAAGIFIGARNREPLIEQLVAEGRVVGVFDEKPSRRPEPMKAHDLPVEDRWMADGDFQSEGGYQAMRAIAESGLRIPEDMSIVGIDGYPFWQYSRPPLTTLEYDFQAMMRGLTSAVIGVVEGEPPGPFPHQVCSSRLVERESCRRLTT